MTCSSVLICGVQQTQNLAVALVCLFLAVLSRQLHGIHVSMQLCASVKDSTKCPLTPGLALNQSSLVHEHTLKISLSLPCNARSQEHTTMAGFLCGYLGFELGSLPKVCPWRAALKGGRKWIFRGTDGFLCWVEYTRRMFKCRCVAGDCCVCFCSYFSFRATGVYYNVLSQRPSRGWRTNLHCCLFFLGPCHPAVLASVPAQLCPLLTLILAISAAMDLLRTVLLQPRLIPRLLYSFSVIWIHHAVEEEENQRVDPSPGFP